MTRSPAIRNKQSYPSRRSNTNPRTGEPLQKWWEVQVMDPRLPPLASFTVSVEVVNEEGPRMQPIVVRTHAVEPPTLLELAKQEARKLGLVPTGNATLMQ